MLGNTSSGEFESKCVVLNVFRIVWRFVVNEGFPGNKMSLNSNAYTLGESFSLQSFRPIVCFPRVLYVCISYGRVVFVRELNESCVPL